MYNRLKCANYETCAICTGFIFVHFAQVSYFVYFAQVSYFAHFAQVSYFAHFAQDSYFAHFAQVSYYANFSRECNNKINYQMHFKKFIF